MCCTTCLDGEPLLLTTREHIELPLGDYAPEWQSVAPSYGSMRRIKMFFDEPTSLLLPAWARPTILSLRLTPVQLALSSNQTMKLTATAARFEETF